MMEVLLKLSSHLWLDVLFNDSSNADEIICSFELIIVG